MHYAHLCATCRNGYAHGPLSGLGDTAPTFAEAVSAAEAALRSLDAKAKVLSVTASDHIKIEIANKAIRLASVTGPMSINRAKATGDWDEIKQLQSGVKNVTDIVGQEMRSSIIDRFLLLPLAWLPPKTFADVNEFKHEVIEDIRTPKAEDIPWYVYAGGGVVALGIVGYFIRAVR